MQPFTVVPVRLLSFFFILLFLIFEAKPFSENVVREGSESSLM